MANYDISEAFEVIEDELISSMMRNLSRHRIEEVQQGFEWEQWQVLQLNALEEYRQRNQKKFPPRFNKLNGQIANALHTSYNNGATSQERQILQAIQNGYQPPVSAFSGQTEITGEFFKTNDRKLNALVNATVSDMSKAEYSILRHTDDQYRQIIFNAQVYANTGAGTYEKAVDMATKDFLKAGINSIQYKNGSRHTIEEYSRMALQTAMKRAYLQGEGEKRKEFGIPTVILKKRTCACPKCLPFVGKVFIDDVWSGGDSSGISPVTGIKYPLLSQAIALGLYHPNCRDTHSIYYEGISTPPEDSTYTVEELDEIAEKYKAEQQQSYCENQADRYHRLSKYSLDSDNKRIYGARAMSWDNKANKRKKFVEQLENSTESDIIKEKDIEWLPKGECISKEVLKDIKDYAATKGILLQGFKKSDVDIELIKETIDSAEEILNTFPELRGSEKRHISFELSEFMKPNNFAEVGQGVSHIITLNANAFRNKEKLAEEYSKLERKKWFVKGTTYKSIPKHEMGHLYQSFHKISDETIIEIALRCARQVAPEKNLNKNTLFKEFFKTDFSGYAGSFDNGSEIISEVFSDFFSNDNPNEFSKLFMNELMKLR